MKKLLFLSMFICSPLYAWGHFFALSTIDVNQVVSCQLSDLTCQREQETMKVLVQALLVQVLEAQMGLESKSVVDTDIEMVNQEGEEYWQNSDYISRLSEQPLRGGSQKTFRVHHGEIRRIAEAHPVYQEWWRIFSHMLEEKHRELFDRVVFYNDADDYYAALVYQEVQSRNGRKSEEWELEVNLANVSLDGASYYREGVETMAHEVGHVLLMNGEQMEFFVDEEDCDTYFVMGLESCAREGSYYDMLREYWDKDFIEWGEEFLELFENDPDEAEGALEIYFMNNEEKHISEYAASSPDEDAAETIAYFATADIPTGELSVADEKILEMYNFDEMIDLRSRTQLLLP